MKPSEKPIIVHAPAPDMSRPALIDELLRAIKPVALPAAFLAPRSGLPALSDERHTGARPSFSEEIRHAQQQMQEILDRPRSHDPVVIRQDGMMMMVKVTHPLHPEYKPPKSPGILQRAINRFKGKS